MMANDNESEVSSQAVNQTKDNLKNEDQQEDPAVAISEDQQGGWLDVLENGQLKKKVLKQGETNGERPQRACKVTISLKTKLTESGQPVPSETFDNAVGFVGDYDFIHGVDLAIPLMCVGEVAAVVINPRFGFGTAGKEPDIPPDSILECEVTLHDSEFIDIENDLSIDERLKFGRFLLIRENNFAYSAIHIIVYVCFHNRRG